VDAANPLVWVEWDDVARHDQWESIVAFGSYEELPGPPAVDRNVGRLPGRAPTDAPLVADDSEIGHERQRASELLRKHANWWEPGCATWATSSTRERTQPFDALYYRIRPDRITGRRGVARRRRISQRGMTTLDRRSKSTVRQFRLVNPCAKSKRARLPPP
jgi:uncharacterized protein